MCALKTCLFVKRCWLPPHRGYGKAFLFKKENKLIDSPDTQTYQARTQGSPLFKHWEYTAG